MSKKRGSIFCLISFLFICGLAISTTYADDWVPFTGSDQIASLTKGYDDTGGSSAICQFYKDGYSYTDFHGLGFVQNRGNGYKCYASVGAEKKILWENGREWATSNFKVLPLSRISGSWTSFDSSRKDFVKGTFEDNTEQFICQADSSDFTNFHGLGMVRYHNGRFRCLATKQNKVIWAPNGNPWGTSKFKVLQSACADLYNGKNFSGATNRVCPAYNWSQNKISAWSSNSSWFPNDTISSIRVPANYAVELCQNSGAASTQNGNQCRTYYTDAASLGYLDNTISRVSLIPFKYDDFYLNVSSDPQYPWTCGNGNSNCNDEGQANIENLNQVDAMNAIKSDVGSDQMAGSIINGDLTAFGHDWQYDKYRDFYEEQLHMNNYPGLGNHDYENNVNDCSENNCASTMVWYMNDAVGALNPVGFDYAVNGPYYDSPSSRKDHSKSAAYSWDVGNVHFVQLNNHPTYERSWNGWNFGSARRDYFTIKSSLAWLNTDLANARARDKSIILNMHDFSSSSSGNSQFVQMLKDYKVSAIFAGHIHSTVGNYKTYYDFHGEGKDLPVFRSGAAVYQTSLLINFRNNQMIVQKVDSSYGSDYSLSPVGTYSLY